MSNRVKVTQVPALGVIWKRIVSYTLQLIGLAEKSLIFTGYEADSVCDSL
jgi:hypothetical protein